MALPYPDKLEHQNPALPLVDDSQLAGAAMDVADETARNAIPLAKRKRGMVVSWVNTGIVLTQKFAGATTADVNWTNNANWLTLDVRALSELSDVVLGTPVLDNVLKFNGTSWFAGNISINAGNGVEFFLTDVIIAGTLNTLSKTPDTNPEDIDTVTVNNNTLLLEAYLYNTALGGAQIDAGEWGFDTYLSVSAVAGVTDMLINIYKVVVGAGTVAITGSGTSRTCTQTGGGSFLAGDANAAVATAGYLQTPLGIFQITAFTNPTIVTIATLVGYVNETGVVFNIHRRLFQAVTDEINDLTVTLHTTLTVQPAFVINATDKMSVFYFARTTAAANRIVSLYHSGTAHYTHFHSPLVERHNDLAGLQGGTTAEFYHITANQSAAVAGANTPSVSNVFFTVNDFVAASLTVAGKIELATQAEVDTGTDAVRAVCPSTMRGSTSSLTRPGVIELATQAEVDAGTDAVRAVCPSTLAAYSGLGGAAASETVAGIAELATQAETDAGTDNARIITPLKLKTVARLYVGAGTELLPSLTFNGDPNTGFWGQAADVIGVSLAGDEKYRFTAGNFHAAADIISNSTTTPSDRRLKKNIRPLKDALKRVLQLSGVTFTRKADKTNATIIGLIAQDVEKICPEVVKEHELLDGNIYKTIDYPALIPVLIEAIKDQQKQIDELKKKLK